MTSIDRTSGRRSWGLALRWSGKLALALSLAACGSPTQRQPDRPPVQDTPRTPSAPVATPVAPGGPVPT